MQVIDSKTLLQKVSERASIEDVFSEISNKSLSSELKNLLHYLSEYIRGKQIIIDNGRMKATVSFNSERTSLPSLPIYFSSNEAYPQKVSDQVGEYAKNVKSFIGIAGALDNYLLLFQSARVNNPNLKGIAVDMHTEQVVFDILKLYLANKEGKFETLSCGYKTVKVAMPEAEIQIYNNTLVEILNSMSHQRVFVYASNVPKIIAYINRKRFTVGGFLDSPDSTKRILSAFNANAAEGSTLMVTEPKPCERVAFIEKTNNGLELKAVYFNRKIVTKSISLLRY